MIEALLLIAVLVAMAILLISIRRISKAAIGSDLGYLSQKGYEKIEKTKGKIKGKRRA